MGPQVVSELGLQLQFHYGSEMGFKRLRATAGQGPNYVGPSCGYMLAYVGVCWPILRATWAHLVAMLAYVGLCWPQVDSC